MAGASPRLLEVPLDLVAPCRCPPLWPACDCPSTRWLPMVWRGWWIRPVAGGWMPCPLAVRDSGLVSGCRPLPGAAPVPAAPLAVSLNLLLLMPSGCWSGTHLHPWQGTLAGWATRPASPWPTHCPHRRGAALTTLVLAALLLWSLTRRWSFPCPLAERME